ncbi:hypothetical protein BDZ90DRAFT_271644 [Jaminaea rosea]|uniref:Uncharacterized protein n=1 Tax=Jaminaea rosea TaxID=1569628 RepID=A0A316UR56_9BASI|nr:hypothetical protein BDZ90DRAFT_271644 [Jaminaea rosea]PWN27782.1 hypothetical protein BDZ90DRAFT_271644 [Jaminaea rosea]
MPDDRPVPPNSGESAAAATEKALDPAPAAGSASATNTRDWTRHDYAYLLRLMVRQLDVNEAGMKISTEFPRYAHNFAINENPPPSREDIIMRCKLLQDEAARYAVALSKVPAQTSLWLPSEAISSEEANVQSVATADIVTQQKNVSINESRKKRKKSKRSSRSTSSPDNTTQGSIDVQIKRKRLRVRGATKGTRVSYVPSDGTIHIDF